MSVKVTPKSTLSMRQVEDHVHPGFTNSVPVICMFLSSLFQERVRIFAINVFLSKTASITEKNMGIQI